VAPVAVLLEEGPRRTFACALDWPGWARSAKTSEGTDAALEALESYRERYVAVLARRGVKAPVGALRVTERVRGDASTDFGVPGRVADADARALRNPERERLATCVEASWDALVLLEPRALRLGPRGGGRSFEKIQRHVQDAEVAYARGLGLRVQDPAGDPAAVSALRARLVGLVRGEIAPDRDAKWPVRYGTRRIAWHALDHVFEIEDRTEA